MSQKPDHLSEENNPDTDDNPVDPYETPIKKKRKSVPRKTPLKSNLMDVDEDEDVAEWSTGKLEIEIVRDPNERDSVKEEKNVTKLTEAGNKKRFLSFEEITAEEMPGSSRGAVRRESGRRKGKSVSYKENEEEGESSDEVVGGVEPQVMEGDPDWDGGAIGVGKRGVVGGRKRRKHVSRLKVKLK